MLSRRNIRIKLMQLLYADAHSTERKDLKKLRSEFNNYLGHTEWLFFYNLAFLYQVAHFSVKDGERRRTKHIPTSIDKIFTPRLYDNDIITSLREDDSLQKQLKRDQIKNNIDLDLVKKVYIEFSKTLEYKNFLRLGDPTNKDYIDILLFLFKFIIKNELFKESLEDLFYFWKTDKSLVIGVMKRYLKSLPSKGAHHESFMPKGDLLEDFADLLLNSTYNQWDKNHAYIEKAVQNWDMERVATLDMILLQMALSELLTFTTIPSKVTINEYVEISKKFSTEKSKEFINGILDRLMKQFSDEGLIIKEGRGLV